MPDYVRTTDGTKARAISYVKDGLLKTDYVKARETSVAQATVEDMAEGIVGFCSGCKAQCHMTFPAGMDHADVDRAIHGKPVKSFCPKCDRLTEFLPASKYLNHPMVMKNQTTN